MCTNPIQLNGFYFHCGKCIECCLSYSNMWAQRCMDEASLYDENCFITLTYAETDGSLHKSDLQKFFKRFRKAIHPRKIRYFACGEYGGKGNRPHYHICCFNYFPPDAKFITKKKGVEYYGSQFIEKLWQGIDEGSRISFAKGCKGGYVSLGRLTRETCKYCAKYLQKLDERPHQVAPFVVMSRKPGIGAHSVSPEMLVDGRMYVDGKSLPIPKFYIDKLKQQGYNVDILKAKREYLYRNSINGFTFDNLSAVDSARKRGKILERRYKKMR